MKIKMMTIAACAAMAISMAYGRTLDELYSVREKIASNDIKNAQSFAETFNVNEWKLVLDDILAMSTTNKSKSVRKMNLWMVLLARCNSANPIRAEYDAKLASAGFKIHIYFYKELPHMVELYLDTTIHTNEFALIKPLIKKYGTGTYRELVELAGIPEAVNCFAQYCVAGSPSKGWKTIVTQNVQKQLKRVMREQGKSFVSVDGKTNPFQDEMDALINALNAPKFAGLKEWFAKWYPSYQWKDIKFKTDEEIKKLQDDIFYGDKMFTDEYKNILQVHLGVEGCNEFIKKYNGDAQ